MKFISLFSVFYITYFLILSILSICESEVIDYLTFVGY